MLNTFFLLLVLVYYMRYAIKFAYDGTAFSGLQRQPDVTTVEGEVIRCLEEHQVISDPKTAKFQVASRTDANVSALGNVLALNSDFKDEDILNILNSKLASCWFYGITEVKNEFNPRHANSRLYRYHIYINDGSEIDIELLGSIVKHFEGSHDFKNFCNPQLDDTQRTIESINLKPDSTWILIDIEARSFLWHQIRRLVSAWIKYARGELTENQVLEALSEPKSRVDFGLAPPEPLMLMDVRYDFEFLVDKTLLKKTQRRIFNNWQKVEIKNYLLNYLMEKI